MPPIVVVSDASVALKWFHAEGEADVEAARALLEAWADGRIALNILDLTPYEIGNALLRGRGMAAERVAVVLEALGDLCPRLTLTAPEQRNAAELAAQHRLSFYDAAYVAAARGRDGNLATADHDLLRLGLGKTPNEVVALL